jgi:Predicted membrane protein (DUF2306)
MSQTVASSRSRSGGHSDALLNGATTLWFVVLLAGQWVFLYFIASFYGPSTLSGNFAAWDENPFISHGYVAGDDMGNLAFAGHVIMAAIIVLGGTLQLIPQIRKHAPWFHRWNGRVFLVSAILASLAGLWMDLTREIAVEGLASNFAISFNGVIVLFLAAFAWRAAAARNIASHRRWALRAFVVVNGVFFLRLLVFGYIVLAQAPPSDLLFDVLTYASYLLPWALVEVYLRAKEGPGVARVAMAAVVVAATAYMATGIAGYYLVFVRRVLGA